MYLLCIVANVAVQVETQQVGRHAHRRHILAGWRWAHCQPANTYHSNCGGGAVQQCNAMQRSAVQSVCTRWCITWPPISVLRQCMAADDAHVPRLLLAIWRGRGCASLPLATLEGSPRPVRFCAVKPASPLCWLSPSLSLSLLASHARWRRGGLR